MFLRRKINEIIELLNWTADSLSALHAKVDRLIAMGLNAAKRDKAMAAGQERFSKELEEFREKFDAYTTAAGENVARAVEEARAAWEASNEEAFNKAADQLDELSKKLETNKPVEGDDGTPVPSGF
jgi:F0F1-type ATP synthase membrane subunit b/b'